MEKMNIMEKMNERIMDDGLAGDVANEMIQDKLENEMYARVSQTGRECNLIVMHPKTWQDLLKEVVVSDGMAINRHDLSLKYRGIRVLRSLDMAEGLFEVQ